eukprot:TRINITY_DN5864_c0_g1_i1.p1 TRINITY_DN5864_c0_g1~~TRINITY_DN5864_c0_g1_i1.p1  ORF type:complete len:71 (+),score=5.67 TRINITY_DN5864_c0_g1_i1:25-237(+)
MCTHYNIIHSNFCCHHCHTSLSFRLCLEVSSLFRGFVKCLWSYAILDFVCPHVLCVDTGRSSETAKAHRG